MIYKRRIIDEILKYLDLDEIIVLLGARQVGKTHILLWLEQYLQEQKKTIYHLDLEDSRFQSLIDEGGVSGFITHLQAEGVYPSKNEKVFIFIDEIQNLKNPSEFLKLMVDHHKEVKLIISGSSSFEIKNKFKDSLVGRTITFEIYNLSFEEYLIFKNFSYDPSQPTSSIKDAQLKDLYKEYVIYGGYPKIALTAETEIKEKRLQQIIDTYIKKDIKELARIENPEAFNRLLEILAAQSGQILNIRELADTCELSVQTVEKYIFILEQTYIIRRVRPFHQNIRSELSKAPKVFFYDSGLMQLLWLKKFPKEIIGNVFETSIFSESVKKYGRDSIYYWRTKNQKEIDLIIKQGDKLKPIEVKINFKKANLSAIRYFSSNYDIDSYQIVGLDGYTGEKGQLYPWRL